MVDHGHGKQRAAAAAALLALAGLLLAVAGLTLFASLAAAAPPLLLLSPVLVPAALLAWLLATGAVASAALALGALSILSRLVRKATTSPSDDDGDCDCVDKGKRRIGELAAVARDRTPHAALAVVSPGQGLTNHKEAKHYVAEPELGKNLKHGVRTQDTTVTTQSSNTIQCWEKRPTTTYAMQCKQAWAE